MIYLHLFKLHKFFHLSFIYLVICKHPDLVFFPSCAELEFMKYIRCYQILLSIYLLLPSGDVQSGTTNTPQISREGL